MNTAPSTTRYTERNVPAQTVHALKARLSLRHPQAESLDKLALAIASAPELLTKKGRDADTVQSILKKLQLDFPSLTDFEREFPSLCFSLATGVGKTRLMGAFIAYLHLAYGINNFFVLAPNLTIYDKLIADFTPNTPKYVFANLLEFNFQSPMIITGENYDSRDMATASLLGQIRINVFNISKINSEVRGGKEPRIKRMNEILGDSYFNDLASLHDLVLIMDESHRYRASAGIKAINELNPLFGLEVTATPFVESTKAPIPFKNIVMDYRLAQAMEDGFVKEPAVVTQRGWSSAGLSHEQIEDIKLKDGVRLHEHTKVQLATYAQESGQKLVKPFMLIIARDTTHASNLKDVIQSEDFFNGHYKDKVIQVDSSKTGKDEEEMTRRLLAVESADEPTEIVIHVNMLKEGWDVTNLYTIVPLRAANARTLIEQSIGRGLRLPYGKRTKVDEIDRLSIVAHDRFQEIIDEANKDDSQIRLKVHYIEPEDTTSIQSVTSISTMDALLGIMPITSDQLGNSPIITTQTEIGQTNYIPRPNPIFTSKSSVDTAQIVQAEIQRYASRVTEVPNSAALLNPEIQRKIIQAVKQAIVPSQTTLDLGEPAIDVAHIVDQVTQIYIQQSIDIPRISVTPSEDVQTGFHPFTLNTYGLRLTPKTQEYMGQNLRDHKLFSIKADEHQQENRPEDLIVFALIDFDDIDYFSQSELLYDLAGQMMRHLQSYQSEEDAAIVVGQNHRLIADNIHAQMQEKFWEKASSYHVVVSRSFVPLKQPHFTAAQGIPVQSIRNTPTGKTPIKQLVFGGFQKCLYQLQKFDSDTERRFAIILERDSLKWLKPAKGQFLLYYKCGVEQPEYVPDFVAETDSYFLIAETKARSDLQSPEVTAKADAAQQWCTHASEISIKPWFYVLIPHDEVKENLQLDDYLRYKI